MQEKFQIPIIGVIEPGAKKAVETTKNGKIGVIGTNGTILSEAYFKEIHKLDPKIRVFSKACPLFVPFVEEGWIEEKATTLVAKRYLSELISSGIDTLILGCTHYPLLKKVIQKEVGESVTLIDSGHETAIFATKVLKEANLLNFSKAVKTSHKYFLTDLPLKFTEVGSNFLGSKIESVEQVELDHEQPTTQHDRRLVDDALHHVARSGRLAGEALEPGRNLQPLLQQPLVERRLE